MNLKECNIVCVNSLVTDIHTKLNNYIVDRLADSVDFDSFLNISLEHNIALKIIIECPRHLDHALLSRRLQSS